MDVRLGDMRIQGERADVYEETRPDGKLGARHRGRGERRVHPRRGAPGRGAARDRRHRARLLRERHRLRAARSLRGGPADRAGRRQDLPRGGGRFTSCAQPNPRWEFKACSAEIEVDDKVVAKNAVFKIKSVPVFYLPYLYYPIREDQRSTGFLFPHFGHSSYQGLRDGHRLLLGHGPELRPDLLRRPLLEDRLGLRPRVPLRGRAALARDLPHLRLRRGRSRQPLDYDLDWNALQMLPGKFRATVNVRQYSDLLFQQQYQDNFNLATTRTQRWSGSSRGPAARHLHRLRGHHQTYFGTTTRGSTAAARRQPAPLPAEDRGAGIVFGYEAKAERVGFGDADAVENFSRFDIAPQVSRPFSSASSRSPRGGLPLHPLQLELRGERGGRDRRLGPADRPALLRDAARRARPDLLARVRRGRALHRPHQARDRPRDQLDLQDAGRRLRPDPEVRRRRLLPRHQPDRLRARAAAPGQAPRAERQDPAPRVPVLAARPDLLRPDLRRPEQLRPQLLVVRLRPRLHARAPLAAPVAPAPAADVPGITGDFNIEYDVNFKQIRRTRFFGELARAARSLPGGWSRAVRLAEKPEERIVGAHSLRGGGAFELVPEAAVPRRLRRLRLRERSSCRCAPGCATRRSAAASCVE